MEIVAEIGSVHDGSFGNAIKLADLAKSCGATVAKFQMHIAEAESTDSAPSPSFFDGERRIDYFRRTSFSDSQWRALRDYCREIGLKFGCSFFSEKALEKLMNLGVDVLKVPSGEVNNLPLLRILKGYKGTVHLSTGMSNWDEIDTAVSQLLDSDLTLFQCTSLYPTLPKDVGLNIISEMKDRFNLQIGFSDHSRGAEMAVAAVALGVSAVEKHITFSRYMYGSDAFNAMEPNEFRQLCKAIMNVVEATRNPVNKDDLSKLNEMRNVFQKGIYAKSDLAKGTIIAREHLVFLKPVGLMSVRFFDEIVGKPLLRDLKELEPLAFGDVL
jgi:N,N'-diacetyllegionaminate synthase